MVSRFKFRISVFGLGGDVTRIDKSQFFVTFEYIYIYI